MANQNYWNRLPIDIQKEIIQYLPINARSKLYQTSTQMSKVPYDCCVEPTMKEIIAYLLQQIKLLQNPETRHLNTLNFHSEVNSIPLFFTNKLLYFYIIMRTDGTFLYRDKKFPIDELISLLSSPDTKFCGKDISNVIRLIRPVLHNRLSCIRQDPDFADKCFLQLLPNYLNADAHWFTWVSDIREIGKNLLLKPDILYKAVKNESHKWNRFKKKLSTTSFNYDDFRTLIDSTLAKQWLTNWLRNFPVSELRPLSTF